MNKKFSPKEVLVPTLTLFIIALVATLLLAMVNSVSRSTSDGLPRREELRRQDRLLRSY